MSPVFDHDCPDCPRVSMKFWLADLRDRDLVWVTILLMTHVACCVTCCAAYLTAYWKWLHQLPNFKFQEPNRPNPHLVRFHLITFQKFHHSSHFCSHRSSPVTAPVWSQPVFGCPKKKLTCKVCSPFYYQIFLFLLELHIMHEFPQIGITRHGGAANRSSQLSSFEKSNSSTTLRLGWQVVPTHSSPALRVKTLSFDPPRIVRVSPENIIHSKNGSKCSRWKWKSIGNYYCWWKKSCTTSNLKNPVNSGINYQPQLVGKRRISEPSTVSDPLPFLRKGLSFSSALVHIRRDNIRLLSCRFSDLWIYSRPKCNLVWNSNKGKTWKNWKTNISHPSRHFWRWFSLSPRWDIYIYITSLNGNQHLGVQSRRFCWQPRCWMRTCMTFTGSSTSTRVVLVIICRIIFRDSQLLSSSFIQQFSR